MQSAPFRISLEASIIMMCVFLVACLSSQGAVWLSQQTLRNTTDRCVQTDNKEDGEASSQATVVELTRYANSQISKYRKST